MIKSRRRMLILKKAETELFLIKEGAVNTENEIILNNGTTQNGTYACATTGQKSFSFKVDVSNYNNIYIDYGFTQLWTSGIGYSTTGIICGYSTSNGTNTGMINTYDVYKTINFIDDASSFTSKVVIIDVSQISGEVYVKGFISWYADRFKTHINNIYLSK